MHAFCDLNIRSVDFLEILRNQPFNGYLKLLNLIVDKGKPFLNHNINTKLEVQCVP